MGGRDKPFQYVHQHIGYRFAYPGVSSGDAIKAIEEVAARTFRWASAMSIQA